MKTMRSVFLEICSARQRIFCDFFLSMRRKVLLKVKRFMQRHNDCGIAACSSVANYYDPTLKYKDIYTTLPTKVIEEGTWTAEQGMLLNNLGFSSVAIVSADTDRFDFSWQKRSDKWKIRRLKKLRAYYRRSEFYTRGDIEFINVYLKFLQMDGCSNKLIIDWDFPKHIKSSIRKSNPIVASINYTSYMKIAKERADTSFDDIHGKTIEHAFVIRGFDDESIYVIDSYGRRVNGYTGYYKIKWEHFLVNIGTGDLIFVN